MKNFKINIGGIKRSYPIISLNKDVKGVYFFLPGDVKLIEKCAEIFFDIINGLDFDIIVTAEAGGIPLAHSLARLTSKNYLVLRKNVKPYMDNPIKEKIKSITTPGVQNIVIDYRDISKVQDKTIVILDDIISTGGTIDGMFGLLSNFNIKLIQILTIFLEGEECLNKLKRKYTCPIYYFDTLPIFTDLNYKL